MTPRQIEALEAAFEKGSAWSARKGSAMGGAYRRMIDDLVGDKLLDDHRATTAAGLRALGNHYRSRTDVGAHASRDVYREKLAKVEAALPALEAEEAEAARDAEEARQRLASRAEARAAEARARKVAAFRSFFAGQSGTFAKLVTGELSDDGLLAFVDRIVAKESAL